MDLKDRRIRVNAVSPGYTDTPPWHAIEEAELICSGHFGFGDQIAFFSGNLPGRLLQISLQLPHAGNDAATL
jgi:NAD(P)-dependent dehydrogenase (short-subunit alcohol dehydrogenase family)